MNMEKPVSIYNDNGEYNYVVKDVVRKMAKVLKESGLSYRDAEKIPNELREYIYASEQNALVNRRFGSMYDD